MILRIEHAAVVGPSHLQLRFNDATTRTVNVESLLNGPIFEPLKDPEYFAKAELDQVCGTVVWPNGADFAPEALLELDAVDESLQTAK